MEENVNLYTEILLYVYIYIYNIIYIYIYIYIYITVVKPLRQPSKVQKTSFLNIAYVAILILGKITNIDCCQFLYNS